MSVAQGMGSVIVVHAISKTYAKLLTHFSGLGDVPVHLDEDMPQQQHNQCTPAGPCTHVDGIKYHTARCHNAHTFTLQAQIK